MDHLEMRLRIAFHFSADLANGFYGLPSMVFNHPGWQPSISQCLQLIRGQFLYVILDGGGVLVDVRLAESCKI